MTILFSDIRDFTSLCEEMTPGETFRFINSFLAALEPAVEAHGGYVDKYIGDAVMALFPGSADDAVAAGVGMLEALETFNGSRGREGRPRIRIGVGLNTGLVMLGIVGGGARLEGTVVSDAVNLASRLEGLTRTYGVPLLAGEQALYALSDAVAHPARYLDRIRVKGKRQPQSVHELYGADPHALRRAKAQTAPQFEQAVAWYHLKEIARAEPLLEACLAAAPEDAPARLYLERCSAFRADGRHEGTGELDGALEWRGEFELGIGIVDSQHRELLRHMNALAGRLRAGDGGGATGLLDFLGQYAVEHFGTEERLMAEHGYPFGAGHVVEHRNFVAFYERLRGEILSGELEQLFLVFRAQVFLLDWFATHSTGTDRHLTRWLRARGVR
jgi:hemerythrin